MKIYIQICEILVFRYSIFPALCHVSVCVCVFIFGFPHDQNSLAEGWYEYVHK